MKDKSKLKDYPRAEYHRAYAKDYYASKRVSILANHKANAHKNEERRLQRVFGLTPDDVAEMFDQQKGCCAVCGRKFGKTKRDKPGVDHCHVTKKVRGLLCNSCNTLLGHAGDSVNTLQNAIKYLQRTRTAK